MRRNCVATVSWWLRPRPGMTLMHLLSLCPPLVWRRSCGILGSLLCACVWSCAGCPSGAMKCEGGKLYVCSAENHQFAQGLEWEVQATCATVGAECRVPDALDGRASKTTACVYPKIECIEPGGTHCVVDPTSDSGILAQCPAQGEAPALYVESGSVPQHCGDV